MHEHDKYFECNQRDYRKYGYQVVKKAIENTTKLFPIKYSNEDQCKLLNELKEKLVISKFLARNLTNSFVILI